MTAPTFHLAQTVHGTLGYWSEGTTVRIARLEMGATSTKEGGIVGPHFVPLVVADRDALFGPTTRTRRRTDGLGLPEVCGCDALNVCGLHASK